MKYYTIKEAAEFLRLSDRRVQQLCKNGELPGAYKHGNTWVIPELATVGVNPLDPLPVGLSDYKRATTEYHYVDKTLLIRDILDDSMPVSLFTRPRRFGKTLNMDMLRVFFEKTQGDTSAYFQDKKIWGCGEHYTRHQGQYPVIFLTLKDVKHRTWEESIRDIKSLIGRECQRHIYLKDSERITEDERAKFSMMAGERGEETVYQESLQFLSTILHKHYGQKAVIIIDEYDTPIQQGHVYGFYQDVVMFMRNFFSKGFKDNPDLAFGFMTGILRVAKESIFSGLNNLRVNSILDDRYSQYFGFTKEEVKDMLAYYNSRDKFEEVCSWYDGYRFGDTEIFNPWSVINYIADRCKPKPFWVSTSSNDLIKEIMEQATPEIKEDLYSLLCGETVTTNVDTSVIYPELQDDPYRIYSFLLVTGYLKIAEVYPSDDGYDLYEIAIPNKEIRLVYKKEVLDLMKQNRGSVKFFQAILNGDRRALQDVLENYMMETISYLDGGSEGFYHGMMLGLCAVVSNEYQIQSNRESGLGRFDVMLIPKKKSMPGFIFEFKHTKDKDADLQTLAEEALRQIHDKRYDAELIAGGVYDVIKIGIAFCGKRAAVAK